MSLVYLVILPILFSFLTPLFANNLRYISLFLHILLFYILYTLSLNVPIIEYVSFNSPLAITFVLNQLNIIFVYLFVSIFFLHNLFYLKDKENNELFITSNILLSGVLGLILSIDIFNIYIFFELASISAYIMTSLNKDKYAYGSAIRYMIIGFVASIFLLLAIMLLYINLGTLNINQISGDFYKLSTKLQFLILLSLFVGFGIKTEIFPLNFWVVNIYSSTKAHIGAFFSSVLSKAYVILFFTLCFSLNIPQNYILFLTILGLISFAVAELSAFKTKNTKKVFAYSTLGQIGLLFISFASQDKVVITGALLLITFHSVAKLMLFLSLDIIEEQCKKSSIEIFKEFNSLFLITIFAIGFLSIVGIPPFGGFVAKLTILKGLSASGHIYLVLAILTVSIVEVVYFFKLLSFYKKDTTNESLKISVSFTQKTALTLMALFLIFNGLYPQYLYDICLQGADYLLGVANV